MFSFLDFRFLNFVKLEWFHFRKSSLHNILTILKTFSWKKNGTVFQKKNDGCRFSFSNCWLEFSHLFVYFTLHSLISFLFLNSKIVTYILRKIAIILEKISTELKITYVINQTEQLPLYVYFHKVTVYKQLFRYTERTWLRIYFWLNWRMW